MGPYRTSILSRDKWQMTTGRKSTNYWKSGPDDIVLTTSPINEGTYLSQTDRRYQNWPRRMTRGQHQHEDTWGCWSHEYHSSLSITLSLLSSDRDDTNEEDYGRYCVTCVAAGLEEEPDSQGKMQNHRGQQESCDHVLETFESRWSTWIPSLQETPRNPKSPVAITLPTWTASNLLYLLSLADHFVHPSRERETQAALFPIWYPEPRLFQASKLSLV